MQKLIHPNIVRCRDIFKTKGNKVVSVSEWCPEGDLRDAVAKREKIQVFFTEAEVLTFFAQVLLGWKFMR